MKTFENTFPAFSPAKMYIMNHFCDSVSEICYCTSEQGLFKPVMPMSCFILVSSLSLYVKNGGDILQNMFKSLYVVLQFQSKILKTLLFYVH